MDNRCEFCGRPLDDDGDCSTCERDWQDGTRLDGGPRDERPSEGDLDYYYNHYYGFGREH